MSTDENTIRKFLADDTASGEPAQELSAEERLRLEIEKFNADPVLDNAALARAKRYQERGAAWAMLHRVYCEKVDREVYFMDYCFKGKERDECIEGNPVIPQCPFAKMSNGQEPCEHYNRYPFGKNKTVSINTKDIKKKK